MRFNDTSLLIAAVAVLFGCESKISFEQNAEVVSSVPTSGDSPSQLIVRCPANDIPGPPTTVVQVLIDQSVSVRAMVPLPVSLEKVKDLVMVLPAGAHLSVRWITDDSFADVVRDSHTGESRHNLVYAGMLPALRPAPQQPDNPYDRASWRDFRKLHADYQRSVRCLQLARDGMVKAISALTADAPEPTRTTDLHGALASSIDHFNAYKDRAAMALLILSDCVDDAGGQIPAESLPSGTAVLVVTAWPNLGYDEVRDIKEAVKELFDSLGTRHILFSSPHHPIVDSFEKLGLINLTWRSKS